LSYVRVVIRKNVDEPRIAKKTRVNGLPSCEYGIILRSFILTQYRRVMDRRTDGQTEILQLIRCSGQLRAVTETDTINSN